MPLNKSTIQDLKKKLTEEKTKVLEQISMLKQDDPFADPDHASDNAAIDTDVREQIGHDTVEAEIKDLERRQKLIDIAVQKIEKNDEYGICERCGREIPLARLQFVPEARYDIDCEKQLIK